MFAVRVAVHGFNLRNLYISIFSFKYYTKHAQLIPHSTLLLRRSVLGSLYHHIYWVPRQQMFASRWWSDWNYIRKYVCFYLSHYIRYPFLFLLYLRRCAPENRRSLQTGKIVFINAEYLTSWYVFNLHLPNPLF